MPQTIEAIVYSFDELSEDAKERAIQDAREDRQRWENPWTDEYRGSLDAFAKEFGIDWSSNHYGDGVYVNEYPTVGGNASRWDIERYDISGESVRGMRLRTYLLNNYQNVLYQYKKYGKRTSRLAVEETCCPFTGFCADADLLDPIRLFIANPRPNVDLNDLMDECLDSYTRSWRAECEHYLSDEDIIEALAYDRRFTEDGEAV